MNDDHDMTRHLPNAEAMPADFEQTEALPTLVDGVSEQASACLLYTSPSPRD